MQEFIEKNGIRINDKGFVCLGDLLKCASRDGKTYKNTSVVLSTAKFRIWLEHNFSIEYDYRKKAHAMLKSHNLQFTTGARNTRVVWVDPKIFEYIYENIYLNNKTASFYRIEQKFISTLRILLDGIIEFEVQKKVLDYKVDVYFPDINLCIEFDESHHDRIKQSLNDAERQQAIEMFLGCKFIRIKEGDYLVGINRILRELDLSY